MPKVFLQDIFAEIRHSKGRFVSIMLIVALGVAFFAGIKASAPDMKNSADSYFDSYNVQDIQVYSTLGLTQDDLDAMKKIKGVENVQGQFSKDFLTRKGSSEMVVKVISYQNDQDINKPRLKEGRMPEAPDECLIEAESATNKLFGSYHLGDRIRLYSSDDSPVSDSLKYSTYIIVGKAYSPNYISYEKGTSTAGSGKVDTFIYVEQAAVKADYFTEADVTVAGARDLNAYSDAYFDLTDPVVDGLEAISERQVSNRIASQQKKVDDARKEMNTQLADAHLSLESGQKDLNAAADEIASGAKKIQDSEALLASSKSQLDAGWSEYYAKKAELDAGRTQVEDGIAQIQQAQSQLALLESQKSQLETTLRLLPVLTNGLNTIQELQARYEDLLAQLKQAQEEDPENPVINEILERLAQVEAQINATIAEVTGDPSMTYEAAIAYITSARDEILAQIGSAENGQALLDQLNDGIAQIQEAAAKLPELEAAKAKLDEGQVQLNAALATLNSAQAQYDSGNAQLSQAKNELESGRQKYDEGKAKLDEGQKEYDSKKADGQKKIDEAQKKIDGLNGEWIILDRNSHYSYRDYQSCADRMDGISSVFPVFFYLVAALVCMTTMTRMVAEQRSEIGTLKALGYSKVQIAMKYLIYAGLASVAGCIIGCASGMVIFPWIIFTAWNTLYNLESIRFVWQPGLILIASLSVTLIVLAATLFSIYRELMEQPSQLMRPKAAKAGKKILLERIPWIWNRVGFMGKVTLRNLFRYKKRFLMTVIGIAGCSALLLSGFGLNDSISDIVNAQFNRIYHYNATVAADRQTDGRLKEKLEKVSGVDSVLQQEILSVVINFNNKDVTAYLNILENPKDLEPYMTFLPMMGSDPAMQLGDDGVFISIKTAEKLGLNPGDEMTFKTASDQVIKTKVTGIFDQYINHQIYVSKKLYDTWHIKEVPNTTFLLLNESTDSDAESQIGADIMNMDEVKSITFYSTLEKNFLDMISAIKLVVVVLVFSAAMLAFVVLYNLSNVNISERLREIATIKVLGFTEKEVNQYVNREALLLAFIGGVLGLGAGIWLHSTIMALAELDDIRFGRTILPQSFVISLALTMAFAAAINWIMKFKLRKIQMVESLKAVE